MVLSTAVLLLLSALVSPSSARPQESVADQVRPRSGEGAAVPSHRANVHAGAHARQRHHPRGYFQYVNVPAHKEYEFGWNRGSPHHYTSRYEQSKDHRFRTRVRWGDKHGGYGEHYWEYNHSPPKYYKEEPAKKEYKEEDDETVQYGPPPKIPSYPARREP